MRPRRIPQRTKIYSAGKTMTKQTIPSRKIIAAAPIPTSATQSASRKLQPNDRLSRRQNQAAIRPTTKGIRKKLGQTSAPEVFSNLVATSQTPKSSPPPIAFAITMPRINCPVGRVGGRGGDDSMKPFSSLAALVDDYLIIRISCPRLKRRVRG